MLHLHFMDTLFTLKQIKLADELAFPDDIKELFKKYLGDEYYYYFLEFKNTYKCSLSAFIFHFSRADLDRYFGERLERILIDILGK